MKERTRDLESSYSALQRTFSEQNYFITKVSDELRSPLMTLKGICALAMKELQYPSAQEYIAKVDSISAQLISVLGRLSPK